MEDSIDELLAHRVSDEELRQVGLSRRDLGIHLRLECGRRVYFDREGIAIEMADGRYLTAKELKEYVDQQHSEPLQGRSGTGEVRYDGVVGWLSCKDLMKMAP